MMNLNYTAVLRDVTAEIDDADEWSELRLVALKHATDAVLSSARVEKLQAKLEASRREIEAASLAEEALLGQIEAKSATIAELREQLAVLRAARACDTLSCFPTEAQIEAHHRSGGSWVYYVPRSGEAHYGTLPNSVWQDGTVLIPLDARGFPCRLGG
jgi:hypothetical protein